MPYFRIIWNEDDADGNVAHIAQNGLTPDDVESVLENPTERDISRSSGLPVYFGFTADGRYIMVVVEEVDDITIYPVTAYEV